MELQDIESILDLLTGTQITEIEIQDAKGAVKISRTPLLESATVIPETSFEISSSLSKKNQLIRSQMVGTVYFSPAFGAKPYIEVGQTIEIGDVICQIEVMKMPNKVTADKSGKITAILVGNGAPIEYNQPLIMLG